MSAPLWTWAELVVASSGKSDHAPPASPITGISIDTRELRHDQPGVVFVALKDQRDGHDFVSIAFANGAVAAIVREGFNAATFGDNRIGPLIEVPIMSDRDPVLEALERIGIAARKRVDRVGDPAKIIAVTGSAGKTGTTQMLRACLRQAASSPDKVHAPEKSFNNHWGVPLTLARMPADTEFGVFEIGMNHAGEIRPLVKMVRPHVAIVTNVLPVHVGNFPDGEVGVANAKAEIFEGMEAGGTAIIPRDGSHLQLLRSVAIACGARIMTFGGTAGAEVCPAEMQLGPDGSTIRLANGTAYKVGAPGRHIAMNSLAVAATLEALRGLGAKLDAKALSALADYRAADGRGARAELKAPGGAVLLIDEGYNANPASVAAALAAMATVARDRFPRRIAVLGDMLELGPQARGYHEGLGAAIATSGADLVFACGANMKFLFDGLPAGQRGTWAPDSGGLIEPVVNALRAGDVVMVKGSLGSRMAPIVDAIKRRFAAAGG